MIKYRFEVHYEPEYLQEVNKFMRCCDIWPETKGACLKYIIIFKAEEDSIDTIKTQVIKSFESAKCKVINIEGGMV